jgi:hypothetical protein
MIQTATELIDVRSLAKRWRCSPSLIYALVSEGKLECFRLGLGRGTIRFSEEQLVRFLDDCRSQALPPEELKHLTL